MAAYPSRRFFLGMASAAAAAGTRATAATLGVVPLFPVHATRILAHEKIVSPRFVTQCAGIGRPHNARLTTVAELYLVAFTAPWTLDQQHATSSD